MRAILYLEYRQFINGIKYNLRSPKRLIPMLLAVLWVTMAFSRPRHTYSYPVESMPMAVRPEIADLVWPFLFLLLSLAAVIIVIIAFAHFPLVFKAAEMDFLFPSAVPRRMVLTFKLLRMHLKTLFYPILLLIFWSSIESDMRRLVLTFEGGSIRLAGVAFLLLVVIAVNIWVAVNLAASFRAGSRWRLALMIRLVLYALAIAAVVGVTISYQRTGELIPSMLQTFKNPVLFAPLLPIRWASDLILSPISGWKPEHGLEFAALCLLAVGTFALAISRKENPYESALSISSWVALTASASRTGDSRKLMAELWKKQRKNDKADKAIPPFGRGATAIVWKNLTMVLRLSLSLYVLLGAGFAVFAALPRIIGIIVRDDPGLSASAVAAFALLPIIGFGSLGALTEFRQDIKQSNSLKSAPIGARDLVLAETIHGTLLTSAICLVIVLLMALLYDIRPVGWLLMLAISAPFVTHACISAQLFSSVLYPNWDSATDQQTGGLLNFACCGIPLGAALALALLFEHLGVGAMLTAVVIIAVSVGISAGGVWLGTYAYRKYDPTDP